MKFAAAGLGIAVAMLAVTRWSEAQAVPHGKAVFDVWCAGCHEPLPGRSFEPPAGTYVLKERYHGRLPEALEQRSDLKPDYIRQMVRNGRNMMPQTRKSEVTDSDLNDLVAYLTHSKQRAQGDP